MVRYVTVIGLLFLTLVSCGQIVSSSRSSSPGYGWAGNSVNTVIFRKNSLVTQKDTQYIAYYDQDQYMVLGKRIVNDTIWQIKRTIFKGNARDAHNCISIMVDGEGYLHVAWDHHGNKLNYAKSVTPGSLELTPKISMTGINEEKVTYPEFYRLENGNLLFFYRDGSSGKGNLVLNRYDIQSKQWKQLHTNLIDGEMKRNAYWQIFVDKKGVIHLSWVWRESPDVASNHDMCYARSADGGTSWVRSSGEKYSLPITAFTAEYAAKIPQQSELINQTSMYADDDGRPLIVSYWREANDSVPQYHIVYKQGNQWKVSNLGFRKTAFSLSGTGTRRIPISRPLIIGGQSGKRSYAIVIFRDAERDDKISFAYCKDIAKPKWEVSDVYHQSLGAWEPTYDSELWKTKKILSLFVQHTEQLNEEGSVEVGEREVRILDFRF